jgi:hypothetical protein
MLSASDNRETNNTRAFCAETHPQGCVFDSARILHVTGLLCADTRVSGQGNGIKIGDNRNQKVAIMSYGIAQSIEDCFSNLKAPRVAITVFIYAGCIAVL